MQYTDEQRAIIRRMGEISARHHAAMDADRAAQAATTQDLVQDVSTALIAAINRSNEAIQRSNEIGALQQEYGDAFREFLDTL